MDSQKKVKNISMNKIIKGKYKIVFYKKNGEIYDYIAFK